MLFLEDQSRLLVVVHAVLGSATVAVTTHLFLWSRKWSRDGRLARGARWFAAVGLGLYVAQFALGNLIYPVYKVRVRAEYFDLPSATEATARVAHEARAEIHARAGAPTPAAIEPAPGPRLARVFDIKEHWAALGFPLMLAAGALIFTWDPKRDGPVPRALLLACSGGAAACAWVAGLIGLVVSAFRSI